MNKRYVITGAAGFIGLHLCQELLKTPGTTVVGIDNERSGDWSRVSPLVEQHKLDVGELTADDWKRLLMPGDVVFHLAAEKYNSSKSTPEKVLSCNVMGTEQMIRAAAEVGVSRFVFTSSLYSYGSMGPDTMSETDVLKPKTIYGASKAVAEDFLRVYNKSHGLSYNVARLFFIYGPNQYADGGYKSVIQVNYERILNNETPVIFGDGEQELDYVFIADCIEALLLLSKSSIDCETVNVASGRGLTINKLTNIMIDVTGQTAEITYGPLDWTANSKRVGNPSRMEAIFDWKTTTTMEDGLSEVWRWMRTQS